MKFRKKAMRPRLQQANLAISQGRGTLVHTSKTFDGFSSIWNTMQKHLFTVIAVASCQFAYARTLLESRNTHLHVNHQRTLLTIVKSIATSELELYSLACTSKIQKATTIALHNSIGCIMVECSNFLLLLRSGFLLFGIFLSLSLQDEQTSNIWHRTTCWATVALYMEG